MNAIVVGCGRVGAELAYRLYCRGHQVTVVDVVGSAFDNLPADFRGRTLEGDVLAQDLLRRAGIEQADALGAVTSSDTLNAVVGHVAQAVFGVKHVVTRTYEPRYRALYEVFDLQTIGPSTWGAQRMDEILSGASLPAVFSAGSGEVEIYEVPVPAAWSGHKFSEFLQGCPCLPVSLTHAGRATLPTDDTRLETGDIIHVSATDDGIGVLRKRLVSAKEA